MQWESALTLGVVQLSHTAGILCKYRYVCTYKENKFFNIQIQRCPQALKRVLVTLLNL